MGLDTLVSVGYSLAYYSLVNLLPCLSRRVGQTHTHTHTHIYTHTHAQACWADKPEDRPSFERVCVWLLEVQEKVGGDECSIM
jgi:hypothetical protein